jgi:hypothetical protein
LRGFRRPSKVLYSVFQQTVWFNALVLSLLETTAAGSSVER